MNICEQQPFYALNKDTSFCLKGLFTIAVLLHHFQQRTYFISQPILGKCFELLGFFAVSVFLFISGFGLMRSYENKGEAYLEYFPVNRIFPLYCINVFLVLLSLIKNIAIGVDVTVTDILSSLFFSGTIITYGWYIQTILLFYSLFYIFFRVVKKDSLRLSLIVLSVIVYIAVSHLASAAPATYISSLAFGLGMLMGKYLYQVQSLFKRKIIILLPSLGIFSLLIILSLITANRHVRYFSRTLASPFFVIIVLVIIEFLCNFRKQIVVNKVTEILGKLSLEIYIAQGFLFDILRSDKIFIENIYIYILGVGVGTFLLAFLFHPIFDFFFSFFKKTVSH